MDSLASIGSFFGSPTGKGIGTLAELGGAGAGLYGNISADQQRAAAAKQAQANANLTPQQLSAMVSGAQQPLNAGLVQAITGNVNANLAEQGLSQAPGLIATAESQALAPFQQNNQQAALQLVLAKLGLPAEFAKTIPQNANLAPLLSMLFKGQATPSTNPNPFQTTGPNPPPPTTDQSTPGGGTQGDYSFGDLFAPGS
jgi:hypothetical protein